MKWWFVVLLVLAPRLISLSVGQGMFARDGITLMMQAIDFSQGLGWQACQHPYHPLVPFLMAPLIKLGFDPVWAGIILSLTAAVVTAFGLLMLGKSIGSLFSARLMVFCFAFHPLAIHYGVDILTESVYGLCLVWGLACFMKALDQKRLWFYAGAGFFAAMAWSTRPEALALPAGLILALCWQLRDGGFAGRGLIIFSASLFLAMMPYLLAMHHVSGGEWHLSMKTNVWQKLGLQDDLGYKHIAHDPYRVADPLPDDQEHQAHLTDAQSRGYRPLTATLIADEWGRGLGKALGLPMILILFFSFMFRLPWLGRQRLLFLMLPMTFFLIACFVQFIDDHYLSARHFYGVTLCLIPVAALAWEGLFKNQHKQKIAWAFFVLVLVFGLARATRHPHRKHVVIKDQAALVAQSPARFLLSQDRRVAWFAQKDWLEFPAEGSDLLMYALKRQLKMVVIKDPIWQEKFEQAGYQHQGLGVMTKP